MFLFLSMPALAASPALEDAHRAWMANDLVGVTTAVRDTLRTDDAAERANALALLQTAWHANGGWLPADWALPAGVRSLSVDQIRIERPGSQHHRLVVHAHTEAEDTLVDLQLTGMGTTLSRAVGQWSASQEESHWYVEVEGVDTDRPTPAGVYDLALTTGDGTVTHGWVVLADHAAQGAPILTAPWPGQQVHGQPTFVWDEYLSGDHADGQGRSVGVWVARTDGGAWSEAWSLWSDEPAVTTATAEGLVPGRYWVALSYRETRTLGPVRIGRVARTGRPFHVALD